MSGIINWIIRVYKMMEMFRNLKKQNCMSNCMLGFHVFRTIQACEIFHTVRVVHPFAERGALKEEEVPPKAKQG